MSHIQSHRVSIELTKGYQFLARFEDAERHTHAACDGRHRSAMAKGQTRRRSRSRRRQLPGREPGVLPAKGPLESDRAHSARDHTRRPRRTRTISHCAGSTSSSLQNWAPRAPIRSAARSCSKTSAP